MSNSCQMARETRFVHVVIDVLASEKFWYSVVGLFGLQIVWFIVSARYPMAFDENFHFGLIQLHAQQWLPFFTHQPPDTAAFGAVTRDPSYLYHWLMSLPYRVIMHSTVNQTAQIITLRCINLGLSLWGLWLMRRLLLTLQLSRSLTHVSLLIYILVPIVPFMGAHISYDNLFIPLTILALLMTIRWVQQYRHGTLSIIQTLLLMSLLMATCLVKYPFLPVLLALLTAITATILRRRHGQVMLRHMVTTSIQQSHRLALAGAILVVLATGGLFIERYGVNLVRYHAPNPSCDAVIGVNDCLQYGPWARDYQYAQSKPTAAKPNVIYFIGMWFGGLWYRSFFAISAAYEARLPLIGPIVASIGTSLLGLYLAGRALMRLLRQQPERLVVVGALTLYLLALFAENLMAYYRTDVPVAINGRYLLPFLPFIIGFVGLGFREIWRNRPRVKVIASVVVLAGFLYGGGLLTFLIRSEDAWFWPQPSIVQINHTARDIAQKLISTTPHDSEDGY